MGALQGLDAPQFSPSPCSMLRAPLRVGTCPCARGEGAVDKTRSSTAGFLLLIFVTPRRSRSVARPRLAEPAHSCSVTEIATRQQTQPLAPHPHYEHRA